LHENASPATRAALGLDLSQQGGRLLSSATGEPSILLNRGGTFGREPAGLGAIQEAMAYYQGRGIKKFLIQVERRATSTADAEFDALPTRLHELGLERARAWRKFRRNIEPLPDFESELRIEILEPRDTGQLEHFGAIAARAFDLGPAAAALLSDLVHDRRWHLLLTLAAGEPAGTGALFVDRHPDSNELVGWLEMGATDPRFRRRGCQRAVMAARIRLGHELGVRSIMTLTGEAVAGDPQHSYGNILKSGFSEGELRDNWRPRTP